MTENGEKGDVEEGKVDVHRFVECTNRRNWNPICWGHHPPNMSSPISVVPRRLSHQIPSTALLQVSRDQICGDRSEWRSGKAEL